MAKDFNVKIIFFINNNIFLGIKKNICQNLIIIIRSYLKFINDWRKFKRIWLIKRWYINNLRIDWTFLGF